MQRNRTVLSVSNEETHAVCRFEIGGSDLTCTASHLRHSALHSMAESAMTE